MSSPLTTTFTPPASCASEWTVLQSAPVTLVKYVSNSDFSLISTCYPPGVTSVDEPFYSPGLICPSGYTTASEGTIEANQYFRYCCPSGYAWQSDNVTCTTSFTSTVVFSVDANGDTQYSTFKSGVAWAEPVGLLYALGDLQLTATTTSGTTDTSTGTATGASGSATASSNTNPTLPTSSDSSSTSLSSGAKAGIAVGVILGVALIALGVFFVLRYQRKRMSDVPPVAAESEPVSEVKQANGDVAQPDAAELHAQSKVPQAELYSHEIHELPAETTPGAELAGSEAVFQLPAESVAATGVQHHTSTAGSPTLGRS